MVLWESRLGNHTVNVQRRALGHYSTFIALPIQSGQCHDVSSSNMAAKNSLGMLGLDLKKKYGFGNFEKQEWEYLACFVDMISELVQDLIDAEGSQASN